MRKVSCKINLFQPTINKLTKAMETALEQTAEALHTEVVQAQVMPRDTGNLQNESTFVDTSDVIMGNVSLVSSTPYARRLYYHPEFHFNKSENPNAGGRWYADWLPDGPHEDFAQKAFNAFYKKETGI